MSVSDLTAASSVHELLAIRHGGVQAIKGRRYADGGGIAAVYCDGTAAEINAAGALLWIGNAEVVL